MKAKMKLPLQVEGYRTVPVEFQKFGFAHNPWIKGNVIREIRRPGEHYFEIVCEGKTYHVPPRHVRKIIMPTRGKIVLVVNRWTRPKQSRFGYKHSRAVGLLLLAFLASPAKAGDDQCLIPPIAPIGCGEPTCICGPNGCDWYFLNCR